MRKLGLAVMCVMGGSLLLCSGCASEKEEVWTSAEYAEQNWEDAIPMLGLLQENQGRMSEQETDVMNKQQFVVEESSEENAEKSEEIMLFASESTQYEGERSEEVKNRQKQNIQEAKEKTQFVKEKIMDPLMERYEKEIREHYGADSEGEEGEHLEVYWFFDYMEDMTIKKEGMYTIYLTAVNVWCHADENVTALPWWDIRLTVELVEKEEGYGFLIWNEKASLDYDVVLEFKENGTWGIHRND